MSEPKPRQLTEKERAFLGTAEGERLDYVEARLAEAERLSKALIDKLAECEPHIANACMMSQIHGVPYTGPNYKTEKDELSAFLSGGGQ